MGLANYIACRVGGWCWMSPGHPSQSSLPSSKRLAQVSSHDGRSFPREWEQSVQGLLRSRLVLPTSLLLLRVTDQSKPRGQPRHRELEGWGPPLGWKNREVTMQRTRLGPLIAVSHRGGACLRRNEIMSVSDTVRLSFLLC